MTVKEKLDLLNLSTDEQQKANKFLASLAFVTEDELKSRINYLESFGIKISKANQIKVITNSETEIAKKIDFLQGIHEIDIYRKDPNAINLNIIAISKRIQYCKQNKKQFNKNAVIEEPKADEELATFEMVDEPIIEPVIQEIDYSNGKIDNEEAPVNQTDTPNFETIRDSLESLKKELAALDADEINFNDLNVEDYEMGRAA